jgi:SAM-dependent methyltransferase
MKKYIKFIWLSFLGLFKSKKYEIKPSYRHRDNVEPFDDTVNEDKWQKEVYIDALKYFETNFFQSVIDIGCGSGYKLVKYFSNYKFVGAEVEPTLSFLKNKYPNSEWIDFEKISNDEFDMIILADVIEHIHDPDIFLLKIINKIRFKVIVISTPEREILNGKYDLGKPKNKSHFREWNKNEFFNFLKQFFEIEHHYISNLTQSTQVAFCKPKQK